MGPSHSVRVMSLVHILLLAPTQYALAQEGDCPALPDEATLESLISSNFYVYTSVNRPNVRIHDFNYVCLASGKFRNTFRGLSVVVSYDCWGSQLCPSASPVSQFDFTCTSNGMWSDIVFSTREYSRRDVADADLTTRNRSNCSFCVAPYHHTVNIPLSYDTITHCIGMLAHQHIVILSRSRINYCILLYMYMQPAVRTAIRIT